MRVLLAGGTGGLGRATAELLASEGWELIVTYLSNAPRAAQLGSIARVIQADITSAADRRRLLLDAAPLNGLVVFAGNPARVASPDQMEDQMRASHEVNYPGLASGPRDRRAHEVRGRAGFDCPVLHDAGRGAVPWLDRICRS